MPWLVAKLVVAGFLLPAAVVFAIAYRHAMRHWLRAAEPIPSAAVASHHGRVHRAASLRRLHAAAIAAAFAGVSIMVLVAVAVIGVIAVSAITP